MRSSAPSGYHDPGEPQPPGEHNQGLPSAPAHRPWAWLLGVAVVAGFAVRAYLALTDQGIYWPDEIYQGLEPAHRLVFGTGLVAWEFVQGARSWAFPGLVAGLFELSRVFHGPAAQVGFVKLAFAAVGAGTIWATFRLARAIGASERDAALAALAFALSAPAIYFAPRAMSETASALPIALGLAWLLDRSSTRARTLGGAALLGFSVFLRLQAGLFCVGALAILFARRERRRALEALVLLAVMALAFGLLDRLTWGGWFHSAKVYLQFNVVENGSAGWGTEGALYYVETLFHSMPFLSPVLAALSLLAVRRALGLWLLTAAFLLAHSLIPHKELRFVFPALPLLCALAAVGLSELAKFGPRVDQVGAVAIALAALVSGVRYHHLTFGQLGAYPERPNANAYDAFSEANRLLLKAYELPDLCGLALGVHPAWTGGYSYLDRNVPLYSIAGPKPPGPRSFNYMIVPAGRFPAVATEGPLALVKRFDGPCDSDPNYSWRLP